MSLSLSLRFFLVILMASLAYTREPCQPGINCKVPHCRCWNDGSIPGRLAADDTPQIVLVSFSYAVNRGNVRDYLKVFEGLFNPNGCPSKGAFFVQGQDSSFDIVSMLYSEGHEIAVTSETGQVPQTLGEWIRSFEDLRARLRQVQIPEYKVQGVRSPSLYFGGDPQLWGMKESGFGYDATCVTRNYTSARGILWPYSLDFAQGSPSCNIGKSPDMAHPGLWEFLMPVLEFKDIKCSTPSACAPALKDEFDAFQLFFGNFMKHYTGNRAPFMMFLDPLWLSDTDHYQGTRKFLELLRDEFKDTWVISYQQALQWIKNPVPIQNAASFVPWSCH